VCLDYAENADFVTDVLYFDELEVNNCDQVDNFRTPDPILVNQQVYKA
jgi:hypothetical protein